MRIIRFLNESEEICFGFDYADQTAVVLKGDIFGDFEKSEKRVPVKKLLAPIRPSAIMCIGLNYREHFEETGMREPEFPVIFMKNPASVVGHESDIILPDSCRDPLQVDYEVELAVIIGKLAKSVSQYEALDYVAGYAVANDVSARTWQLKGGGHQWIRGKSFDTFCPIGPELVMKDEVIDPDHLEISCKLNGDIMQKGNTSDMIFSIRKLISFLSEDTTLLPGTVILTGTPSGVGFTRTPPVFLKPGDRLELTIENVGTLINTVR